MRKASNRQRLKSHRSVSPLNRTLNNSKENLNNKKRADKKNGVGKEIREETARNKVEDSMKMCLELASHHQQNAVELKAKNEQLQKKIKEQVKDMESLRCEISNIKVLLTGSYTSNKEVEEQKKTIAQLQVENEKLKQDNKQLVKATEVMEQVVNQYKTQNAKYDEQIRQLRVRLEDMSVIKTESMQDESVAWSALSALPVARQSRRQQLAQNYECFMKEADDTDEESISYKQMRESYCQELMDMQRELSHCRSMCVRTQQLQKQLTHKTDCLNCLGQYLSKLEENSRGVLSAMAGIQSQVETLMKEKSSMGSRSTSIKVSSSHCLV